MDIQVSGEQAAIAAVALAFGRPLLELLWKELRERLSKKEDQLDKNDAKLAAQVYELATEVKAGMKALEISLAKGEVRFGEMERRITRLKETDHCCRHCPHE